MHGTPMEKEMLCGISQVKSFARLADLEAENIATKWPFQAPMSHKYHLDTAITNRTQSEEKQLAFT